MSHLVTLDAVTRDFPPQTFALRDATFAIDEDESVAIMGPSGSGKSTLLAILGLLDSATNGTYLFDGVDISTLDEKERTHTRRQALAFIFQSFHLIPHLTALENVMDGLRIAGIHHSKRRSIALDALETVGLWHRTASLPAVMSGGEQQRVAIARAIARKPRLLLCDEPTGNLDSEASGRVMQGILCVTNTTNTAVVVVTHDPNVAALCAARCGFETASCTTDSTVQAKVLHERPDQLRFSRHRAQMAAQPDERHSGAHRCGNPRYCDRSERVRCAESR